MTRVIRAELMRLANRRTAMTTAVVLIAFALVAGLAVFLSAGAVGGGDGRAPSLVELGRRGGGTQAFATGMAFAGVPVFVIVIALLAGEHSSGTMRALLLREPRRLRLLAGKVAGLWVFIAVALVVAEVLTAGVSLVLAPGQGVPTAAWLSASSIGAAVGDYGSALLAVTGWLALGVAVGIVVRSTPLALAVGIVWSGPFEHLFQDAWRPAGRWFPGLLLESVAAGGNLDVAQGRAVLTFAGYGLVAAVLTSVVFVRRDVTA